ncbi:MAG: hypothetical protein KC731_32275, partial [Myxococcales bacterium]|nr:hypothetical protein [Myxococcales bacterium]
AEAELTTDAMMEFAGVDQLGGTAALNYASPLRGNINPTLRRQLHQIRENALAARGACMLDADTFAPSPTAMIGLTRILQEKFGKFNPGDDRAAQNARAERMRHYLAERMHYAVIIHEMGHTFGYRHNFVSSSSAFNYRPQYWQLRTRNGQVTQACTDLAMGQDAEDCIGPRYYDAITENETDNLIGMFSHSSVMDYAGDYTQDLLGLGAYDFAAAKMFYGDTATMFADEDMKYTQQVPKGQALTEGLLDNFGGIIGYNYDAPRPSLQVQGAFEPIHYTQLHNEYQLINSCGPVDVTEAGEADGTMTYESATFKPSYWDEETMGKWHPVVDGLIVKVDGQYSRCFQRRVANRSWESLRFPNVDGFYRGGPAISPADDLTRYPYAFATDRWADLGNLSVYRHDIGADPYELFNFFITEQEVMHIFNDYRRNRQQFSVRGAANRILTRYNEKMRDAAKGMTLIYNNIKQVALDGGDDPDQLWKLYVDVFGWTDNMTASTLAFDHFARQMQRPQAGPHRTNPTDSVLEFDDFQAPNVLIPNGVQGFWQDVGIGGKPVENALAEDKGEYNAEFTVNAGSYYDKNYTTMLLTESVDNFISDSLDDFTDPRYRAVSIADLFPDGYRRWLSNNLTDDRQIKGARMVGLNAISPDVRADLFPNYPLRFTSWTGDQPSVCFPNSGTSICSTYDSNGQLIDPLLPAATIAIDPQIGWEQQKFLIAWTLVYLPENQKEVWLDMMNIWNVGEDSDPGFTNRIELHIPNGDVYVARTYGTEEICFETCKTVQRGIGARILEYANQLLAQGYANTPVVTPGATWYEPTYSNGAPVVTNAGAAEHLADFISVPNFMRHAMRDFHMASPSQKGIY